MVVARGNCTETASTPVVCHTGWRIGFDPQILQMKKNVFIMWFRWNIKSHIIFPIDYSKVCCGKLFLSIDSRCIKSKQHSGPRGLFHTPCVSVAECRLSGANAASYWESYVLDATRRWAVKTKTIRLMFHFTGGGIRRKPLFHIYHSSLSSSWILIYLCSCRSVVK